MTIESSHPLRWEYAADGIQTEFPFDTLIFADSDLAVYQNDTLLTLNTHYTVTNAGVPSGGNVVFVAAPVAGLTVTLLSVIPALQGTDLTEGGALPAEVVEAQLDRLARVSQQILEILGRVPQFKPTSRFRDVLLDEPVLGKIAGWSDDLTRLMNQDRNPVGATGLQGIPGPPGAGAAPIVREADGTPSVAVPSAIEFDGAVVTEPSAGVARVTIPTPTSVPTGAVLLYTAAAAPTGFLLCDGAAVSRATYAALFAVIGVAFGVGDGTTTFNVPDPRGRVPLGAGVGPGLTARSLAAVGGAETHQLTLAQLPSHSHGLSMVNTTPLAATGGNPVVQVGTGLTSDLAGGDGAHPIMPPWLGFTMIIKT